MEYLNIIIISKTYNCSVVLLLIIENVGMSNCNDFDKLYQIL